MAWPTRTQLLGLLIVLAALVTFVLVRMALS
jgi:preprotein translocase subunit SecE